MELVRYLCVCLLWSFLWFDVSSGCNYEPATALLDGVQEPRARHRLQLLFPLLLRISTRLATLVPTALMALFGVILFVFFSKKALIVSLFALFLTLADKYKNKNEEIHVHKINSYDDYNDEEHIHYHHGWKPGKPYYYQKRKNHIRRTLPHIPLHDLPPDVIVQPFKPLTGFGKRTLWENTSPVMFPPAPDEDNLTSTDDTEEWN